ncbi:lytic polysaccharide monooxygenase [Hafnia alvei]
MNKKLHALISTSVLAAGIMLYCQGSYAHGYVTSPPSRAYQCQQGVNHDCGSVQYEPQSIEGQGQFPSGGPADGHLASGGKDNFGDLDSQSPTRWVKTSIKSGDNTFVWNLTAQHKTSSWKYYLTKPGWNNAKPLTRADFNLKPFCQFNDNGAMPDQTVTHKCTIPTGNTGYQVILAVWNIEDTTNAFYQAIDVNITD